MSLNIQFDVTSLANPKLSGIGIYAKNLIEALSKNSQLSLSGTWKLSRWKHRDTISQNFSHPHRPYYPFIDRHFFQNADIHHGPDFKIFPYSHKKGPKKIVTFHDLFVFTPGLTSEEFALRMQAQIKKTLSQHRPDLIIAVSEFTKGQIIEHFPEYENKIQVIYHGADHLKFIDLTSSTPATRPPYFLFVGNLEARKNITRLLQAFDQFCHEGSPELVLVGAPGFGYQEIQQTYQAMKNKNKVIWAGRVSDQELRELYQNALAFTYPSLYEGFGLPLIEAMSLNCPVLTSSGSATKEVAQKAALYVDETSIDSLSEGLHQILTSPELREALRQKGAQQVQKFTWAKCAQETLLAYRSILDS